MKVTETRREGLERACQVVITSEELDAEVESRLERMAKEANIRGFRPGKVPVTVLKRRYGASVAREALNELTKSGLEQHIEDLDENVAVQPYPYKDADNSTEDGIASNWSYEVFPDVPDLNFSDISIEKITLDHDWDEELEEMLKSVAVNNGEATARDENYAARNHDRVSLDILGQLNSPSERVKREEVTVLAGQPNHFETYSNDLVGVSAGQNVEATLQPPTGPVTKPDLPYGLSLNCRIREVWEVDPAPIDDAMATSFGKESLQALRDDFKRNRDTQFSSMADTILRVRLMDAIDEMVDFEVPPTVLKQELISVAGQLSAPSSGPAPEDEPSPAADGQEAIAKTSEPVEVEGPAPEVEADDANASGGTAEFSEEARKVALRRVRAMYLFLDISGKNNLRPSEEEVTRYIRDVSRDQRHFEEIMKRIQGDESLAHQYWFQVLDRRTQDYILEFVDIRHRSVPKAEFIQEFETDVNKASPDTVSPPDDQAEGSQDGPVDQGRTHVG